MEHHIDYAAMKEHQEKYDQIMKEKKKEKLELSRLSSQSKSSSVHHYPSKFYKALVREEKKEK